MIVDRLFWSESCNMIPHFFYIDLESVNRVCLCCYYRRYHAEGIQFVYFVLFEETQSEINQCTSNTVNLIVQPIDRFRYLQTARNNANPNWIPFNMNNGTSWFDTKFTYFCNVNLYTKTSQSECVLWQDRLQYSFEISTYYILSFTDELWTAKSVTFSVLTIKFMVFGVVNFTANLLIFWLCFHKTLSKRNGRMKHNCSKKKSYFFYFCSSISTFFVEYVQVRTCYILVDSSYITRVGKKSYTQQRPKTLCS